MSFKDYFPVFNPNPRRRYTVGYHHYGKNGLKYTTLKYSFRPSKKLFGKTLHNVRKNWINNMYINRKVVI